MNITEITPQKQQTEQIIRLAPYCRVSSNSEDQLHSFAAQIRHYTEYVKRNPQLRLVDIYADEGITGTDMEKRGELQRLIRDCKKGKIDRIIVKSVSRFARNTEELLITIRALKEIGVSIYFEEQGIDTDKMNMEMIVTFPGMAAQQESEAISGNLRWSIKKRMESGEYNCTYPAFGYYQKNGQLTIIEEEAVIVRRIFDLYLQGYGKQAIANILNREDIQRENKTKWYAHTIFYILNNERYMGDALLQKKYTTDTLPYQLKTNHGEKPQYYVENSNPAIVSREVYQSVQTLQMERAKILGKKTGNFLLTGKIRCPDCGRVFRRQTTNNVPYWICTGRTSGATACQSRRLKEQEIYESYMMLMTNLQGNRKCLIGSLISQIEELQFRANSSNQRIGEIDKEIADLGSRNLVIARLHSKGILNASDYSAQSSEINNKITALRIERRKLITADEDDELLDDLKTLDGILEETVIDSDFNKGLFEQIVIEIKPVDNTRLTFKLLGGIELTEEIREKGRCKTA